MEQGILVELGETFFFSFFLLKNQRNFIFQMGEGVHGKGTEMKARETESGKKTVAGKRWDGGEEGCFVFGRNKSS